MPDDSRLAGVWLDEGFREALSGLLQMNPSALRQLRPATFSVREGLSATGVDLTTDQKAVAVAVVRFLSSLARRAGSPDPVLDELSELVRGTAEAERLHVVRPLLEEILAIDPDTARRERYERVQEAIFPVLELAEGAVDLRVAASDPDEPEGQSPRLIPVVTLRLGFDEPVQGGHVVSFQLTDLAAERLRTELERVQRVRDDTVRALGDIVEPPP